jgi:hypothetical protein
VASPRTIRQTAAVARILAAVRTGDSAAGATADDAEEAIRLGARSKVQ